VIRDLSFELADGEVLALRGPNGAGKSTLLRALAGLLLAAGRVALDGRALGDDPDAHAERVAYAGHLDAVKPQLTVAENLAFWAALYGGDPAAALAAWGLGGMLAPRRLWLLDEPTVALDADAVARLVEAVRRHRAGGGLAVIATHAPLGLPARELALAPEGGHVDPFLTGAWA
jgi:heme exporter protein A